MYFYADSNIYFDRLVTFESKERTNKHLWSYTFSVKLWAYFYKLNVWFERNYCVLLVYLLAWAWTNVHVVSISICFRLSYFLNQFNIAFQILVLFDIIYIDQSLWVNIYNIPISLSGLYHIQIIPDLFWPIKLLCPETEMT